MDYANSRSVTGMTHFQQRQARFPDLNLPVHEFHACAFRRRVARIPRYVRGGESYL